MIGRSVVAEHRENMMLLSSQCLFLSVEHNHGFEEWFCILIDRDERDCLGWLSTPEEKGHQFDCDRCEKSTIQEKNECKKRMEAKMRKKK